MDSHDDPFGRSEGSIRSKESTHIDYAFITHEDYGKNGHHPGDGGAGFSGRLRLQDFQLFYGDNRSDGNNG